VKFSGVLPQGLSVTDFSVQPPELKIAGPESRVAAVREAISDPFDLNLVTGDTSQSLAVYMPEPQVRFLDRPRVIVSIHTKLVH
jgi:YbbR domain-containing protein